MLMAVLYDDSGRVKGLAQKSDPSRILNQTVFVGSLHYGIVSRIPKEAAAMTEEVIKKLVVSKIKDDGTVEVKLAR